MMLISFSHPWYLLLLPLMVAGAVYVARMSLADLRGARAKWSLGLRIAILVCAVLALAGLQIRQPAKRLAVLFVMDQSDSIPTEQKRQALDYVNEAARKMGPNDEGGVVVFGSDAYVELEAKPVLNLKRIHSLPPRDYTNLAGAVRLALAAFPENTQKRIVLLSDGNENLGQAVQEAAGAVSAAVSIDVVPITYKYEREVMLDKMVTPSEAKIGEPFEVRIIARSTTKTNAVIRLQRNGELIAQQQVDLLSGANVITFHQSLEQARFHTFEATIETKSDTLPDNNRALGFTLVKGKPKVLIVDSDPADARYLAAALQGQQLEVDVRGPGELPATLAEFQTYDSIVLSNVAAYQLTVDQQKAIQSSVRDLGAGLVMVGGENSYGPGAYKGTPIEEALPVDMEVKKQKVMPVGAVAMVLHTCEFPDGNRWAAETAAAVVDVLGNRDKVGVLLFDTGERWGLPIQPAANKERIKSEIYNLNPGDAPDFQPFLNLAYQGLMTDAKEAAVKHVIIISDGDPSPPTPELLAKLARAKITISTVAVFPHGGGTGTLENVAAIGKGQFYNVRRPSEIPRIFLKEAQRVLKPAIIEETFVPNTLPESQLLQGINRVPPLRGYVAVSPKGAASVEVAMTSKNDDPVLASWRYGLGKSVAFMSDAKNRWAAPWVAQGSPFAKFGAQTLRWTVRSTARADLDTTVEIAQRKGKVTIDVVDAKGNFVNMLPLTGSVAGEKSSPTLRIDQTAPGRYEGTFDANEKGQYMIGLRYVDKEGTPRINTVGAAVAYSPEYRDLAANSAVLTNLAETTGGKVYPTLTNDKPHEQDLKRLWRHDGRAHQAPQDLWPALLLLSALLLPVDIGVRRLMISRSEWAAFAAAAYAATLGRIGGRRETEQEKSTNRLLTAKQRAGRRLGTDAAAVEETPVEEAPVETTQTAAEPSRPRYEGPARRMPEKPGAAVTPPPPPSAAPRSTGEERPAMAMAEQEGRGKREEAREVLEAAPEAPKSAETPRQAAERPPKQPAVVWNRPVPGVTDQAPPPKASTPPAEAPKPETKPEESGDDGSTSRLLRAKRRARENKDE